MKNSYIFLLIALLLIAVHFTGWLTKPCNCPNSDKSKTDKLKAEYQHFKDSTVEHSNELTLKYVEGKDSTNKLLKTLAELKAKIYVKKVAKSLLNPDMGNPITEDCLDDCETEKALQDLVIKKQQQDAELADSALAAKDAALSSFESLAAMEGKTKIDLKMDNDKLRKKKHTRNVELFVLGLIDTAKNIYIAKKLKVF